MKIFEEKNLPYFEFWGQAANCAEKLTYKELETIESMLEELYPDGIDATNLNDLFAYEFETVCEWLGLDESEVLERE